MKGITNAQKDVSDLATKGELALKADQSALDSTNTEIAKKANQSDLTALQTAVAGKADASVVTELQTAVEGKQNKLPAGTSGQILVSTGVAGEGVWKNGNEVSSITANFVTKDYLEEYVLSIPPGYNVTILFDTTKDTSLFASSTKYSYASAYVYEGRDLDKRIQSNGETGAVNNTGSLPVNYTIPLKKFNPFGNFYNVGLAKYTHQSDLSSANLKTILNNILSVRGNHSGRISFTLVAKIIFGNDEPFATKAQGSSSGNIPDFEGIDVRFTLNISYSKNIISSIEVSNIVNSSSIYSYIRTYTSSEQSSKKNRVKLIPISASNFSYPSS